MAKKLTSYPALLKYCVEKIDAKKLPPQAQERFRDLMWDITVKAARQDFYTFVKVIAPILIPEFKTGRHIEIIANELQRLYENIHGNNKDESKVQVFLPPESMKTVLCSHLFPVWLLGRHPDYRIIAVSHAADHAAKELGANSKRIVSLPEYQTIFPKTKVSRESSGTGFWKTTKGGYYFSGGHATQYPGKRANLLLCDDVVSEQTPPSTLKTINKNYASGLESRLLENYSGQLVVNTRWYIEDLSGFLEGRDGGVTPSGVQTTDKISKRPWRIVKVPAILDQEGYDLLTHDRPDLVERFEVGGSYWPEHKNLDNLMDKKRTSTPHQWAALWMQTPIAEEGAIFSKSMFKEWRHKEPPEVSSVVISLDTAFSEKETRDAAESAYEVWGIFPMKETTSTGKESIQGNMILLGYRKGYWSFPELKEICKSLYDEYGSVLDFFLIEDRASGISLIQELQATGIPVVPYQPDKDKVSRAHSAAALVHSGRVYLNPNLLFSMEFLSEILKFPAGGLDTTDAFTQAALWMRNSWNIVPQDYLAYSYDEDEHTNRRPPTYWDSVSNTTTHLIN